MKQIAPLILLTLLLMSASLAGAAQAADHPQQATYSGSYVCQKMGAATGILRVPIDLVIRDDSVQFARPLLDGRGTQVVGSEMAFGTIDSDGQLHIKSHWNNGGLSINAEYTGMLTATGATLVGTQTFHAGGMTGTRTCTAALVQTVQGRSTPQQ
jgi:hypothetical protein